MAYKLAKKKIPRRTEDLLYEEVGPGLYEDETLVTLRSGELVAVSVEREWLTNGAGIQLRGYARLVNDDGSTQLHDGADIESVHAATITPSILEKYGADELANEVALIVLGEPPALIVSDQTAEGKEVKLPLIGLDDDTRLGSSIQHQLRAIKAAKKSALKL
jgi:hypothetical protein